MMWFAYAVIWLATSGAVCFGIYRTGDISCLWALLIPGLLSFSSNRSDKSVNANSQRKETDNDED